MGGYPGGAGRRFWQGAVRKAVAGCVAMAAFPVLAQYQVHQWANFEDGKIPEGTVTIGPNVQQTLQVVKFSDVAGMPDSFSKGDGASETGKHGLKLTANPKPPEFKTYTTGLTVGQILDRDKLESTGRSLYQADFYVPAEGYIPSLSVLAAEAPETDGRINNVTNLTKAFYRFGFTKGKQLYFSAFFPGKKDASIFLNDPELLKQIPRGGWHRFAIVMEGAETIRCFVDGREAGFSPVKEPSLRKLMVGVMLAENEHPYDAYVDNLSIQVADDAPALPESPYSEGWKIAAGPSKGARAAAVATPKPAAPASGSGWMEANAAWERAQKEKIPLLLYFYAPGLPGTTKMDEMFATNPAAKAFLGRHAAARVDVNQLQGGETAKKYSVYKVPTLIVISPDAQNYKRSTPPRNATWDQIAAELELK